MHRLLAASLLAMSLALACGSSPGGSADPRPDLAPVADGEQEADEASEDSRPDAEPVRRLEFVDAFGDDQVSCVGVDTCTLNPGFDNDRSLRVRYTVDGAPVEGVAIDFVLTVDPDSLGHLSAGSAQTDASGIAIVMVRLSHVEGAECISGFVEVSVQVAEQPSVPPLKFVAHAHVDCLGGYLAVSFTYGGTKAFDGVTVYLYKSDELDVAYIACADIPPIDLPVADLSKGPHQLSQTAKFSMLPDIEDEKEQFYTIVARGELVDGTPVTFGCNDTDGRVKLTAMTKHVSIALEDIPCAEGLCCDLACDAGTHCEWSGDEMVCEGDPCVPACTEVGQHCEKGACVANVCAVDCMAYEYCDDDLLCQPFVCEPACAKEQHCEADNTCAPNECPVECNAAGCGLSYCGRDGACVDDVSLCGCNCGGTPLAPVCGLTDQEPNPFVTFDNLCELTCANAIVADCASLPVQPVCDVAGYVANPSANNTYDNVCYAACAGVPIESLGAGECSCSTTCTEAEIGYGPVCGNDGITYANLCALACASVVKESDGACPCSSAWSPVCGQSVLEPGKQYTYGNACIAEAVYGVTNYTAGACALCTMVCAEAPGNPICGLDGVTYPDVCYMVKCNGDAMAKGLDDARCYGACESCP